MATLIGKTLGESVSIHYVCNIIIKQKHHMENQGYCQALKNILSSAELDKDSACSILEPTVSDGKAYKTKVYNLDALLSVSCRVNSKNTTAITNLL